MWAHGPLSPADAQKVARAARRAHRRQLTGAGEAVRHAAQDLAGPAGESAITLQQLLDHAAVGGYAPVTVRDAITEHARAGDGCLTRLRMGVFRLRQAGDASGVTPRSASSWVLEALTSLSGRVGRPVTRCEVERELLALGPRYSTRAVCKALADLRLDPRSGVVADIRGRYRVRD